MRVESGGQEFLNGDLITSGAGAMGLMQVMPETYDELRDRYNLGDDPFDPHDNIIAGVAYMREMYELYGSPGFLAAYNAGPARLDDYLANVRPLPDETRRYVAMIGPNLRGIYPNNRSAADELAMNALPVNIPPGRRFGRPVLLAGARPGSGGRVPNRAAGGGRTASGVAAPRYAGASTGTRWSHPHRRRSRTAASTSSPPRTPPTPHPPLVTARPRLASGPFRSVPSATRARRTARCSWRRVMPTWNWRSHILMLPASIRAAPSCGARG